MSIAVADDSKDDTLAPRFFGLSYEISALLPQDGRYYFDSNDRALINTFETLGIKSLRVGANAVDDPHVPVPQEKDIDKLFNFARAAGVKVIYSFRLKDGNPAESARLAAYINAHDADALSCFAIGNEPNFYLKTFDDYFAQWKLHYDAILKAVPDAMFAGPSVANRPPAAENLYPLQLARAIFTQGHLAMVSDHYYFLGRRNEVEKDPPASRARFLSNDVDATYESAYAQIGAKLAAQGIPYRIDELNNCARGGAQGSSDTYASTLWALDCIHWWAAHHILGMDFHTGEFKDSDGTIGAPNYSAFVHQTDGRGFEMRPESYAYLAFSQGAHGRPLEVNLKTTPTFNFSAYAFKNMDGSVFLTLINKSYGNEAQTASASIQLAQSMKQGTWQRMDLIQKSQNVAATTGVTLGGAAINSQGIWSGHWSKINPEDRSSDLTIQVAPASATLLRFSSDEVKPAIKTVSVLKE